MEKEIGCCSTHLLDGDGTFNGDGLDNFMEQIKLKDCGVSYVVVAIMGPQSSGKSTLLNHLFRTNFTEMDAYEGRSQTTKGIWMARCLDIEPCTVVMDLEGSDGRERGENDTAFEKQIALFGLAVSDIVLINMWCHSIGLDQGANKPLLRIVFEVMLRLFTSRKTTLMFVIRDKTPVTPLERLERTLREDIQKIWDGVPKPPEHKKTLLSDFFNVQVVGLTSYQERPEQFTEEVASLREKFFRSTTPGGLAGDRRGVVPASGFSFSAKHIWEVIKENKDLDLPAHKVMVATIRCEEIANENYSSFVANKDWLEIEEASQLHLVQGFGDKIRSLLHDCLSSYDEETTYFEEGARFAKRDQLEEMLIHHVQPAYHLMFDHIASITLGNFKLALMETLNGGQGFVAAARDCSHNFMNVFDEQCQDIVIEQVKGESSKVKDKFSSDLVSHISEVRTSRLSTLTSQYEYKLKEALYGHVGDLLKGGTDDTWHTIKNILRRETETTISDFERYGFEMDEQDIKDIISTLKNYARGIVEGKARDEAAKVLSHLKERFTFLFGHDNDSTPRTWTGKEDIQAITKTAMSSCLKLLSILVAIRLDENTDTIGDKLECALANPEGTQNALASNIWEEVSETKTLITPIECDKVWNQFKLETQNTIIQATNSQVMIASIRCEEIADEKYTSFVANKDLLEREERVATVQTRLVRNFGNKLSSLLHNCLSSYDKETTYFEETSKSTKRKHLEDKLIQDVQETCHSMLEVITSIILSDFKLALTEALNGRKGFVVSARDCYQKYMSIFDKQCQDINVKNVNWDSTKQKKELERDLDYHVVEVRTAKLSSLTSLYKATLKENVCKPVEDLLKEGNDDTWSSIRELVSLETGKVISEFELVGFEMSEEANNMKSDLINYARSLVEENTIEEVKMVSTRMNERFTSLFNNDKNSKPRVWAADDDIEALAESPHLSCLTLLYVLAAIRLDEEDETDKIWDTLVLLVDDPKQAQTILAAETWENVRVTKTLISPMECKSLWDRFLKETDYDIKEANTCRKSKKKKKIMKKVAIGVTGTAAATLVVCSAGVAGVAIATVAGGAPAVAAAVAAAPTLAAAVANAPIVAAAAAAVAPAVTISVGFINHMFDK